MSQNRVMAAVCAGLLAVSLTACGSKANTAEDEATDSEKIELVTLNVDPEDLEEITYGDQVVLADDDFATIALIDLHQEVVNWADYGESIETYATLSITNKSDATFDVRFTGTVNDKAVSIASVTGYEGPEKGETKQYRCLINGNDNGTHTSIEKLEDLYTLKGNVQVYVYNEDGSEYDDEQYREYEINFSKASEAAVASADEDEGAEEATEPEAEAESDETAASEDEVIVEDNDSSEVLDVSEDGAEAESEG